MSFLWLKASWIQIHDFQRRTLLSLDMSRRGLVRVVRLANNNSLFKIQRACTIKCLLDDDSTYGNRPRLYLEVAVLEDRSGGS
jgi:hypothetical protein